MTRSGRKYKKVEMADEGTTRRNFGNTTMLELGEFKTSKSVGVQHTDIGNDFKTLTGFFPPLQSDIVPILRRYRV